MLFDKSCTKSNASLPATLSQTIQHLSWNNILYSSLPLIKIGFTANVAIFTQEIDDYADTIIVIASADLEKHSTLIQPLNFMKKLVWTTDSEFKTFDMLHWRNQA